MVVHILSVILILEVVVQRRCEVIVLGPERVIDWMKLRQKEETSVVVKRYRLGTV